MVHEKEKFVIIDGNALIHRSFHALPLTLTTKTGEVVNAVYGFASILLKVLKDFKPKYIAVTFDKKAPTFRHKIYPEYKAHREKAPDELYKQIPYIKKLVTVFNIPIFEMSGFEADDLIGTMCQKINNISDQKIIDNIIITGDMDALQLINEHTRVYAMSRGLSDGIIFDDRNVEEKYGIKVGQMIDYKALRGDPSDNIPGVRGIGEKTAVALLQEFDNLDNLYSEIEKNNGQLKNCTPRIVDLLKAHKEEAYLSKKLATIKQDIPLDFDLHSLKFGNFDLREIVNFFSDLEFKSLLSRVNELGKMNSENVKTVSADDKFARNKELFNYQLVVEEKDFEIFFQKLKQQKEFTFDTETSSLDPLTCDLLGISFSWQEGEAYFLKINNVDKNETDKKTSLNLFNYNSQDLSSSINATEDKSLASNLFLKKIKPIFEDEKIKKNGHNMKFDLSVLANFGIKVAGINFDTMIASYLLNPGNRQHNLDYVTFSELGFEKISKDDLLGVGKNKINFSEVAIDKLMLYSCEDADFTQRLVLKLKQQLQSENLMDLFFQIEMPLVEVLTKMENNGIKVDSDFLIGMNKDLQKRIIALEKKIHALAGQDFNVKSTKQLKEILFEKLQISTKNIKKTKTGFSTAFEELEKLKDEHEIIPLLQEHRELVKLVSTYIETLPELINQKTKRVHTSFNQTVAATGRLSSTDPNLQNIPIKTELGREIRRAFVVDQGNKMVAIDYSQIELRIAAHLTQDKKMIEAFNSGADIHASTGAAINGVKIEEVTPEMRRDAKAINFGILYGQGAHGLSQTAGISFAAARDFIEKYFETFPDIKKYINEVIEKTKKNGYTETLFQRKRALPEINSSVVMIKKAAERMAVNTPIQGTAADIIKKAMIEVHQYIKKRNKDDVKMLLQVHDELVFEMQQDQVQEISGDIKSIMENVVKFSIPIVADIKTGDNWGQMEKM